MKQKKLKKQRVICSYTHQGELPGFFPTIAFIHFQFQVLNQNLGFLNFHFGKYSQINFTSDNCFSIKSMGEKVLMEELLH